LPMLAQQQKVDIDAGGDLHAMPVRPKRLIRTAKGVKVETRSSQKKKPPMYSSLPTQDTTISKENSTKQNKVRKLKTISAGLSVANNLMSSPTSA